jgi:hypothetical protein
LKSKYLNRWFCRCNKRRDAKRFTFEAMFKTKFNHHLFTKIHLSFFYLVMLVTGLYSCNEKAEIKNVERSFYYWKSVVKPTEFDLKCLDSLKVQTIYFRFFDVDWEPASKQAIPVAKMQAADKSLFQQYNIIPTVFITNECIQQIDSLQTIALAGKINGLIKDLCQINQINTINEIQIDCDWTVSTAKKYFMLLNTIHQLSQTNLSATIRLHQIKFFTKTGVPPVSRGLLMCYNMGNLKNPATKNSIIETAELKKYIANLSNYPLPLDIAFPLFGWKVLFRDHIYKGLLENLQDDLFTSSFSSRKNGRIEILKDTLLAGYNLKKGDLLRSEESDIQTIVEAAKEINLHFKNTQQRVSLYHLDSVILKKYTTHDLESIYNSFH